jgi:peptide deformylase
MRPDPTNPDPADLRILNYPDPSLRQKARPVGPVTPAVRAIAQRMLELMRQAEGIGLAAPQVGLPWRLFVVDIPSNDERSSDVVPPSATTGPVVYIDPALTSPMGDLESFEEGCLSLPDIRGDVLRPETITIEATNLDGARFTQTGTGLLARCWQHEFDHLEGVLILDRMSQMSRLKNKPAIRDLERSATQTPYR